MDVTAKATAFAAPLAQRRHRIARMPGKTLFKHMADWVELGTIEEIGEADALVLPCSQGFDFDNWLRDVPADLWRRISHDQLPVIFDASGEGRRYSSDTIADLHQFIRRLELSPWQCVYITQHRFFEADYKRDPPDFGLQMRIMNYDYFIRRFFDFGRQNAEKMFRARLARFQARQSNRPLYLPQQYPPADQAGVPAQGAGRWLSRQGHGLHRRLRQRQQLSGRPAAQGRLVHLGRLSRPSPARS